MANKKIMTKEELQAKHRLEEAQCGIGERAKGPYQTLDSRRVLFGRKYFQRLSKSGALKITGLVMRVSTNCEGRSVKGPPLSLFIPRVT
ncbi:hypothetical protein [Faecalibacterium taiwanense]|uniref:hypothetical protein n=1 Tax=Faecalibacterium taiwanense TaxID=3030638 RepID=UPI003AADA041